MNLTNPNQPLTDRLSSILNTLGDKISGYGSAGECGRIQ